MNWFYVFTNVLIDLFQCQFYFDRLVLIHCSYDWAHNFFVLTVVQFFKRSCSMGLKKFVLFFLVCELALCGLCLHVFVVFSKFCFDHWNFRSTESHFIFLKYMLWFSNLIFVLCLRVKRFIDWVFLLVVGSLILVKCFFLPSLLCDCQLQWMKPTGPFILLTWLGWSNCLMVLCIIRCSTPNRGPSRPL